MKCTAKIYDLTDGSCVTTVGAPYRFQRTSIHTFCFTNDKNIPDYLDFKELREYFSDIVEPDLINSPEHYKQGGIECIDYLQAKLTPEEFKGYLKGNALKYLSRATMKGNEAQDVAKSQWYINKLNSVFK